MKQLALRLLQTEGPIELEGQPGQRLQRGLVQQALDRADERRPRACWILVGHNASAQSHLDRGPQSAGVEYTRKGKVIGFSEKMVLHMLRRRIIIVLFPAPGKLTVIEQFFFST